MPDDSPGNVIRILIVDDHGLFRESMSRLLAVEPDFEIVAQCGTRPPPRSTHILIDVMLLDFRSVKTGSSVIKW
jgi:two-component system nitrate/nitrite response regulator NarL